MGFITINKYFGSSDRKLYKRILKLLNQINMNDQNVLDQLNAIGSKLNEAKDEITTKISELQTEIQNAGQTSPEVQAKLDELTASANQLADIVPNAPVESNGEEAQG